MNPVFDAALEVQTLFQEQEWEFCIIGGLEVTTQDADFSLLTGFDDEDEFLTVIAGTFAAREPNEIESARSARISNIAWKSSAKWVRTSRLLQNLMN